MNSFFLPFDFPYRTRISTDSEIVNNIYLLLLIFVVFSERASI